MASTCYLNPNSNYIEEAPTIFEGNSKSDQTAGIYISLEDHNLIDIMENIKRQSTPIYVDDGIIDHPTVF
eukprot:5112400-Amphidinium_carterae.1